MGQANSKLATLKDDDERLPIHWATSYNHLPIVELLVGRKDFDPDVQVYYTMCISNPQDDAEYGTGCLWLDTAHDSSKSSGRR
jgi:ankyrin repeat protein